MKKYLILLLSSLGILFTQAWVKEYEPKDKSDLGKLLFFDPILSRDSTISCGSCHKPEFAFADTAIFSIGVGGKTGVRNTPTSMNMRFQEFFFWDGRAKSLEEQALAPIENPDEMDLAIEDAVMRLRKSKTYSAYFRKLFNADPTAQSLAESLAAFQRRLETSDSPFDNWKFYDRPDLVGDDVKRGFDVFSGKGKCTQCHFGSDFTQSEFKNIGLFDGKKFNDSGRAFITHLKEDIGKFKTPTLRNIGVTWPYMHNGMFKTLMEVIEFYNDPEKIIPGSINRDTALAKPLGLTEWEKKDLEAFLFALTDKQFERKDIYFGR